MMGYTHLLVGFMIALIGKGYWAGDNLFIVMILLGSLLPDIDAENSIIGRKMKMASGFLTHRGFTHSLSGMLVFVALLQAFLFMTKIETDVSAFMIGYLAHLTADSLTPKGVEPFYPLKFRVRGPVQTNSLAEKIIFTALLAIAVKIVYF